MGLLDGFVVKIADQPWELEAIERLNYKTFVEEIPQHKPNPDKRLSDRFHHQNVYFICVHEGRRKLAGMVAYRDQRPFSLDEKLGDLDAYLPPGRSICEIRLLAIEKEYRYTRIAQKLIGMVFKHACDRDHDLGVISGTVRQLKLYSFLGFTPFGPLVGSESARYQPMYITLEAYRDLKGRSRAFAGGAADQKNSDDTHLFNFLPGPVDFSTEVRESYGVMPCSHRDETFLKDFEKTRSLLCDLVHARQVEIMMGPGTLANDAIAGQLSLLGSAGLILVSGEFGRRLTRNCQGARLRFHVLEIDEGSTFSRDHLESALDAHQEVEWVWGTHCETSTGVLHDIGMYKEICTARDKKLCLDCISSIGTVPVDLEGVYLASGTSGKGLASFSGLAMVFHNHDLQPAPAGVPCILDLGYYQQCKGVPFTLQSNHVYALKTAMASQNWTNRYRAVRDWSSSVRRHLSEIGVEALAADSCAMPSVITIPLPKNKQSLAVGDALKKAGILVSYQSGYLVARNWIQICMMGVESRPVDKFIRLLKRELGLNVPAAAGVGGPAAPADTAAPYSEA